MKISAYAVKNYQFTLVMFLMVVVIGITTIMNMPRSEDPDMNAPKYPIIAVYPGTSPKDMEELVVDPLEKRIYELENIKRVRSTIRDGVAILEVDYKYEVNVDDKYQELVREVNSLKAELPKELLRLEVQKVSPSNVNVLQISLVSNNASRERMKEYAEELQTRLEKITALKNVEIAGLPEQQVRVDLDLPKMSGMHLTAERVMQAIQSELANIPGGSVVENNKSFNVKTSGNYQDLDEIKNTVVSSYNGSNILLKDVAAVYYDFDAEKHITRLNGNRAVFVVAAQKPGENIAKTMEKYQPVLEEYKKILPSNIDMQVQFDQATNVSKRLTGLSIDFLIAIFLVAITLLPLGIRAATVVMISIPLSLAIGIILLDFLGYSLNQLSIVGLVVALGLLVDDSIVVVENIERWMREGHSRWDATLKATNQIGQAVIGCTATLVIAFMPLVFLPESSGDFIRSLPTAVITSILASMVVSLTIVPFLSSRLLKSHGMDYEGNIFLKGLKKLISGSYSRVLDLALRKPVHSIVVALLIFVASLRIIPVIGFSLFPASEKPQFIVNVNTPLQSSLAYTDSITRILEKQLLSIPEVEYVSTNVGKGNPRIYYNVITENEQSSLAQFFVQLKPNILTAEKLKMVEQLRKKWLVFPGAKVEVKNFEQGPPVVAPVEVRLQGDNLDTLRSLAMQVEQLLLQTKGTLYVNNPLKNLKSDIKVDINKEKASMLGIPTVFVDKTVRMAVAGMELGSFNNAEGEDFPIVVGVPAPKYPGIDVLEKLYISGMNGNAVPLSQIAKLHLQTSPLQINHINKGRTVSVSANVGEGYLNDEVIKDVIKRMNAFHFPSGYSYKMGGEIETREESFGGFGKVIIFTVFIFIAVLILEFGTFKSTLIVLSVIPLGIVGAVLALWFTGNSLSFVATVGLIALAGIEVKNTILLVDFTNQLRAEGKSIEEAIREAGEVRFLPIILTTLTAIGGLLPIAISTNPLISPLAIVMIGGLISSTLLSRVVTPVLYKLIPPKIKPIENTKSL